MTVVPTGRTAPTAGNSPLLIFQYFSIRYDSLENSTGRAGGVSRKRARHSLDFRVHIRLAGALDFNQQRGCVRSETGEKIRHTGLAGH